jgi:hypothetical protein
VDISRARISVPYRHRQIACRCCRDSRIRQLGERVHSSARSVAFKAQNVAVFDQTFFSGYSILINAVIFTAVAFFALQESDRAFRLGDFVGFSARFAAFFVALVSMSETLLGLLGLVPTYGRAKKYSKLA